MLQPAASPPPRLRVRPHAPLPSRPLLIPLVGEAAASLAALRASIHAALFGEGLPATSQVLHVPDTQLVLRLDDFEICGRPSEVLRDGDLIDVHALLQLQAPAARPVSAALSALGVKSEAASRSGGSRAATPGKRVRDVNDEGEPGQGERGQGSGRTRRRNAQRRLKHRDGLNEDSVEGGVSGDVLGSSGGGDDDWEDAEAVAWDDEEDGMEWAGNDGLADGDGDELDGEVGDEHGLDGDGGAVSDEDDAGALGQLSAPDAEEELLFEAQKIADKMRRRFGAGADAESSDEASEAGEAPIDDLPRMDSLAQPPKPTAAAPTAMPLPPVGLLAPPLKYGFQPASGLLARGGPETGAAAALRAFEERKRAMRGQAPTSANGANTSASATNEQSARNGRAASSASSSSSSSSSSAASSASSSSSSSSSPSSSKLPERDAGHVAAAPRAPDGAKPNVLPGAGSARTRRKNASRRAKERAREDARRAAEFEEIRRRVLNSTTGKGASDLAANMANGKDASDSSTSDDSSDSSESSSSSDDTSSDDGDSDAPAPGAAEPDDAAWSISHAPGRAVLVQQRTVAETPPHALPPGGGLLGLPQPEQVSAPEKPSALEERPSALEERPSALEDIALRLLDRPRKRAGVRPSKSELASPAAAHAVAQSPLTKSAPSAVAPPAAAASSAAQSPAAAATSSAAQSPARRAPPPPSTLAKVPPQVRVRALDCTTWYDAAWSEGWPQQWYDDNADDAAQQSWSALQAQARGTAQPEKSVIVAATPEDLAAEELRAQLGLPRSFGNAETYVLSAAPESEPEEGQASSSHPALSPRGNSQPGSSQPGSSQQGSPLWTQPLSRLPAWPFKPAAAAPAPGASKATTSAASQATSQPNTPAAPASKATTSAAAQPPAAPASQAITSAAQPPVAVQARKSTSPSLAKFAPVRTKTAAPAPQTDAAAHQSAPADGAGLDYSSPSPPPSRPPQSLPAKPSAALPAKPAPLVVADALVQARLAALASRRARS